MTILARTLRLCIYYLFCFLLKLFDFDCVISSKTRWILVAKKLSLKAAASDSFYHFEISIFVHFLYLNLLVELGIIGIAKNIPKLLLCTCFIICFSLQIFGFGCVIFPKLGRCLLLKKFNFLWKLQLLIFSYQFQIDFHAFFIFESFKTNRNFRYSELFENKRKIIIIFILKQKCI